MTTRRRRYLAGFIRGPRLRTLVFYGRDPLPFTQSGKTLVNPATVLDHTEREVRQGSPADPWLSIVPTGRPGFQHSNSVTIAKCLVLIERGLRGIPLEETADWFQDSDSDLGELAAAAGLTERQREAVSMVAEGWNVTEIAQWLGLTHQTVSQHLHYGRRKLLRQPLPVDRYLRSGVLSL